jgi:hypothetical protein
MSHSRCQELKTTPDQALADFEPSLSFAGPREYRWQGLEVPVMMAKRRGTAQIITAPPTGCAASNRHKNLLFSQLARSLCTAGET